MMAAYMFHLFMPRVACPSKYGVLFFLIFYNGNGSTNGRFENKWGKLSFNVLKRRIKKIEKNGNVHLWYMEKRRVEGECIDKYNISL